MNIKKLAGNIASIFTTNNSKSTEDVNAILEKNNMDGSIIVCEKTPDYIDIDLATERSSFSLRCVWSKEDSKDFTLHYGFLENSNSNGGSATAENDEWFIFNMNKSIENVKKELQSSIARLTSNHDSTTINKFIDTTFKACH
jgi:hypothetical protein